MRCSGLATNGRWLTGFILVGLLLAGCDSAPPAADRQPQSRPASRTMPESAPTTQPTTQPATQPAPAEPELPEYLKIVNRFDADAAVDVRIPVAAGRHLVIETRNVQRLHIERAKLPLDTKHSIVLILDGQGLEWLARSNVVDFERSANGVWSPVKPDKPDEQSTP